MSALATFAYSSPSQVVVSAKRANSGWSIDARMSIGAARSAGGIARTAKP